MDSIEAHGLSQRTAHLEWYVDVTWHDSNMIKTSSSNYTNAEFRLTYFLPIIPGVCCSYRICQLHDKNHNCGDSPFVKFKLITGLLGPLTERREPRVLLQTLVFLRNAIEC